MKNIGNFYLKIFSFLEVKFSIYLNRHVFVMSLVLQKQLDDEQCRHRATHYAASVWVYTVPPLRIQKRQYVQKRIDVNIYFRILLVLDSVPGTIKMYNITKTYLYNFDPLKPHFYIVKLGFTGVYIIFVISAQNIDCGYSLEPPRRGGSNEYPQSMFWAEIWKISEFFIWKNCQFLVVKFSIYLNRRVFVMICWINYINWNGYIFRRSIFFFGTIMKSHLIPKT